MFRRTFTALAMLACSAVVANAAGEAPSGKGDPVKGAQVFKRCAICHTAERGGADGLGPNLFGIAGTKAATRPGYSFSPALKQSGLVWDEATMTKWVAAPARLVPKNKMSFAGITSKKQQADLVAYLEKLK
jgi:cytochrome c